MIIVSVRHRGLRRFIEDGNPRYLRPELTERIRKIIAALLSVESINELLNGNPSGWRIHQLSGGRADEWSISVSGNWRITFTIRGREVHHLNLEDYH